MARARGEADKRGKKGTQEHERCYVREEEGAGTHTLRLASNLSPAPSRPAGPQPPRLTFTTLANYAARKNRQHAARKLTYYLWGRKTFLTTLFNMN